MSKDSILSVSAFAFFGACMIYIFWNYYQERYEYIVETQNKFEMVGCVRANTVLGYKVIGFDGINSCEVINHLGHTVSFNYEQMSVLADINSEEL